MIRLLAIVPFQVAWIKSDSKAILAIHNHVITNNDRLQVRQYFPKDKDKLENIFVSLSALPKGGHYFHGAILTQLVGIFQIPGCQMKDMDIIFP